MYVNVTSCMQYFLSLGYSWFELCSISLFILLDNNKFNMLYEFSVYIELYYHTF